MIFSIHYLVVSFFINVTLVPVSIDNKFYQWTWPMQVHINNPICGTSSLFYKWSRLGQTLSAKIGPRASTLLWLTDWLAGEAESSKFRAGSWEVECAGYMWWHIELIRLVNLYLSRCIYDKRWPVMCTFVEMNGKKENEM